ncbi:PREDICTED: protein EMRE homolog, mitochondrial [Polistes dominula]|uniref:Essential MCU regulator, mitochondrial n=1 Tax=Polistes dominula TaxID=743375 RepID=A0ABM1I8R2_POLDO|nr:PREDICTED: protein EMRE homolog, mitochondrial [Polistes dominula]
MVLQRLTSIASTRVQILSGLKYMNKKGIRSKITTPSGAILPEPKRTPFGYLRVIGGILLGLVVGASLSKKMANFLEENDLFVPSDDDDDDD